MTAQPEIHVLLQLSGFLLLSGVYSFLLKEPPSKNVEPWFAEPIPNVTIAAGREVILPCVVEYLGNYRLAWIHKDRHTLLTLHERVITRNPRYSISHNSHRTWWLHISQVEEKDRGQYMCQINTSPMKSQVGFLEVVVPPKIDEAYTSSDTDVREGADVSLQCRASGSPPPDIKWRREDERDIVIGSKRDSTVESEFLSITKTSRLHMGAYLCIASNGVQPSVSKRIMLNVNFAPMVLIPNHFIGAAVGSDVVLDCNLESHPRSVTYWMREGGIMIISNAKYDSLTREVGLYKVKMQLRIHHLHPNDFGSYTCVAKNSLGETEGTIILYEVPPPTSIMARGQGQDPAERRALSNEVDGELLPAPNNIKQDLKKKSELHSEDRARHFLPAGVAHNTVFRESTGDEGNTSTGSLCIPPTLVSFLLITIIIG